MGDVNIKLNMSILTIFSIFLISLVLIGSVSAADIGDDGAQPLTQANDTEITSIDDANEILNEGESGTLVDLAGEIRNGGDTVVLSKKSYSYDGSGNTISINTAKVIDGNGTVINLEGATFRLFDIHSTGVTLQNITFKNLKNYMNGAIASFEEYGTVDNCNFINITAQMSSGGSLYFIKGGEVTNSNFTDNYAYNVGGAVYFYGEGTVDNCNFVNNVVGNQMVVLFTLKVQVL